MTECSFLHPETQIVTIVQLPCREISANEFKWAFNQGY